MADFKFTELSSTRPADLKAQRAAGVTEGLDKFEKKVAERAQVGAMAASLHAGESEEQALAVGAATEEVVTKNIDMAVDSQLSALTPDITPTNLTEVSEQMQRQGELDEQFRQDISFLDQIKAAIDEYTLTMAGIRQIADSVREDFPVDPTFDPLEDRDLYEQGLDENDRRWLRDVGSAEERLWKLERIRERKENEKILGAHGGARAVAASLLGGIVDPAGWIAGYGVGKAAQLVGLGARAAWVAGNRARAVGYAAGEGAVGNVLFEAALDASGQHVSFSDYVYAAGFGAAFGQLSLLGARQRDLVDDLVQAPDNMTINAVRGELEAIRKAREAGETALDEDSMRANVKNRTKGVRKSTEVLRDLMDADDPTISAMAARLYTLWGDEIDVYTASEEGFRSHFDPTQQRIVLGEGVEPWVQLRVLARGATADRIRYGRKQPNSTIGRLTAELDTLRETAHKASIGVPFKDSRTSYYLKNTDEFIAGLYSGQAEFHDFLRSLKVAEKDDTLLNKMVTIVRRILGMAESDQNMLSKAIGLSDNLMQTNFKVKYVQYPRSGRGKPVTLERDQSPQGRDLPAEFTALVKEQGGELVEGAKEQNVELYKKAQDRAGEDASPEQIAATAEAVLNDEYANTLRIALADVQEGDRILPKLTEGDIDPETGQLKPVDELLSDPELRAEVGKRWGTDLIEDPATKAFVEELAVRAEIWNRQHPVMEERTKSILARVPWLATTGLQLVRSKHPVARFIAGNLLEVTTGAAGRRRSAAITKVMRERIYQSYLAKYEREYEQFRRMNGGSAIKDVIGTQMRAEFDLQVAIHRENRRLGISDDANPAVVRAADHLDEGYNVMRIDQQKVGTIGAARLGDNSIGYAPRSISSGWVARATAAQRAAVVSVLEKQLDEAWALFSFESAIKVKPGDIAKRYLERALTKAYGGETIPAYLDSPEASRILGDVLRAEGLTDDQIEKALGRFSRGGQKHTKKRLELDLSAELVLEDGTTFRLMEAFDTDQSKLYLDYSRRVSGDVALTQHGLPGEQGMKLVRKALEFGPDGQRATLQEMEAFDQIAAEFFGKPIGKNNSNVLDNLRLLTAASRLGGMAFTQFAETANIVGALGVKAALDNIKGLPRMIAEMRAGKSNPILDSIERIGGEIGTDHKVVFPYQQSNDIRVFGRDSLSAVDRIVRGGANALPWINGWHYLHSAQVRGVTEQIVHKMFRYVREGGEDAALRSMGLGDDLVARVKADLDNVATFDDAGNLIALDLTKTTDPAATAELVQAIHRGGKQIIQGLFIGETGKWAHDGFLRILTQFRSFSITAAEKQWTRQRVDVGTTKAFGLLMGSMAFALPIHFARVQLAAAGREDREEYLDAQLAPDMLIRATLNYASLAGISGDIFDGIAATAGYEMSGVRGFGRNFLDNIPAAGYVNTAARAVTDQDPRDLIRSLPGGNLPFLIPVLNAAAE